ncbi:diacylglycerol kinase family protein [Virgibacillus indicus]|uniref:diacylglycerol kinase family protein n=1 Tax=Virgibacillus indicus TaxID=2024554 RepID=UPI0013FDCD87|nr:diacylglycerol kinase family protein [Virgibacillus indicus]
MKDKKRTIGFSYAWNGIKHVIRTERNFRFHLMAAILVIIAGIVFHISHVEWSLVMIVIGLVLILEMINTAIEKLIDYLKPEINPAAKIIKDISAAAVLISAITAAAIGLIIFIPKIIIIL